jgi:hypothetical protein
MFAMAVGWLVGRLIGRYEWLDVQLRDSAGTGGRQGTTELDLGLEVHLP